MFRAKTFLPAWRGRLVPAGRGGLRGSRSHLQGEHSPLGLQLPLFAAHGVGYVSVGKDQREGEKAEVLRS